MSAFQSTQASSWSGDRGSEGSKERKLACPANSEGGKAIPDMLMTGKSGEKKVGTGWIAAKAAKTVGWVRSGVDTVYWPAQEGRGRKIAVSIELQQRDNGKGVGKLAGHSRVV